MKHWERILAVVIAFIVTVLSCLHIFVNLFGKRLLINKLETTFQRKAEVGSVTTAFPTNVYVTNIEVKDLFTIDEVVAVGGLFDIFRKSFRLSSLKLIRPIVTLSRESDNPDAEFTVSSDLDSEQANTSRFSAAKTAIASRIRNKISFSPGFYIGRLFVSEGIITFIDKGIEAGPIKIRVEDINAKVENFILLAKLSQVTNFELRGEIPWYKDNQKGSIEIAGWVNFFKKDIRASLNINNIDGISLHPYYAKWVDLEKSRIQQAALNFSSEITGRDNDVTADCHLELSDIVFRPKEDDEQETKAYKIAAAVLDIFKAINGRVNLDFTIKTKLDHPQLSFDNIRNAVEERITDSTKQDNKLDMVLLFPAKLLENTVKGATDITKALIEGTAAVGVQLKKGAEEIFKKEASKNN